MAFASARWTLLVVAAGFAVVSVIVYFTTGDFSSGWLITSGIVYSLIVVAAVVLAALDRAPANKPRGPSREPRLVQRELIYRTRGAETLRLTYEWPDGTSEARFVVTAPGAMFTHPEIATYADALPAAEIGPRLAQEIDEALARREVPAEEKA